MQINQKSLKIIINKNNLYYKLSNIKNIEKSLVKPAG